MIVKEEGQFKRDEGLTFSFEVTSPGMMGGFGGRFGGLLREEFSPSRDFQLRHMAVGGRMGWPHGPWVMYGIIHYHTLPDTSKPRSK